MKLRNKYNLGDVVYYPAADLNSARLLKGKVSGIVITESEGEVIVAYQTGQSYGVKETDMFKTAKPALKRLVAILKEKKGDIAKNIDNVIKELQLTNPKDITMDLTAVEEDNENLPQ